MAARPPTQPKRAVRSPGSLPQTAALPRADGAAFRQRMAALWAGIRTGSTGPALAAFFPRDAYVQLKQIYAASSDWQNRLVRDYALDLQAAHALLGAGARDARLLRVQVPSSYGHWVPPGVCSNGVGYYEVANSRVVYSEGGRIESFGIASMISWRGEWYVVHLGAILREVEGGVVEEPSAGAGTSAPSSTC